MRTLEVAEHVLLAEFGTSMRAEKINNSLLAGMLNHLAEQRLDAAHIDIQSPTAAGSGRCRSARGSRPPIPVAELNVFFQEGTTASL